MPFFKHTLPKLTLLVASALLFSTGTGKAQSAWSGVAAVHYSLPDSGVIQPSGAPTVLLWAGAPSAQVPASARSFTWEDRRFLLEQTEDKKRIKLVDVLVGEGMLALLSTAGFAKNGAYWSAGGLHLMSLAPPTQKDSWLQNDASQFVLMGLMNGLAAHHYFVKPTSGAPVFWRNFLGLNAVMGTTFLIDKTISRRKARRLQ